MLPESSELKQIKLVAGLGNPGKKYQNTRHNIGFFVVDLMQKQFNGEAGSKYDSQIYSCFEYGRKIFLQEPMSYMNNSGIPIHKLAKKLGIEPEEILLIYDDIDLEPGFLKIKEGGGHGGHNGVRSAIKELKSNNFYRLKIGVGRDKHGKDVADHVLSKCTEEEIDMFAKSANIAAEAAIKLLYKPCDEVMNEYNNKNVEG